MTDILLMPHVASPANVQRAVRPAEPKMASHRPSLPVTLNSQRVRQDPGPRCECSAPARAPSAQSLHSAPKNRASFHNSRHKHDCTAAKDAPAHTVHTAIHLHVAPMAETERGSRCLLARPRSPQSAARASHEHTTLLGHTSMGGRRRLLSSPGKPAKRGRKTATQTVPQKQAQ